MVSASLAEGDEAILKAFDGIYLIKLDVDEWSWDPPGFRFDGIPVFYKLDALGKSTGDMIDGGAWGEDNPENIARVMDEFFHRQP